jgi:hypothetical protein
VVPGVSGGQRLGVGKKWDATCSHFYIMPLVRVRVMLGQAQLACPMRPFAASATLALVVNKALEPFADVTITILDIFSDPAESPMKKTEVFPDDFESITLSDVAELGFYWVACVQRADALRTPAARAGSAAAASSSGIGGSSSGGLPDSLQEMIQRERGVQVTWPPPATGPTFNVRIFNALLVNLKAEGLGWHPADCAHPDASGPKVLKGLAHAF